MSTASSTRGDDWYGAGYGQGKPDIDAWYAKNRDSITLEPRTRDRVEYWMQQIARAIWRRGGSL